MSKYFFLLFLFSKITFASQYNCHILKFDEGCLITPEASTNKILIYFRGHLNGNGHISASKRIESAKQAAIFYKLDKLAESKGIAIFVTGSSHVRISQTDLDILKPSYNSEVYLASHSGGFVGLHKSLLTYREKINSIFMLDNFYFGKTLTDEINKLVGKGTRCSGFFTEHNRLRLRSRFSSIIKHSSCPIMNSYSHNADVYPFLNKSL